MNTFKAAACAVALVVTVTVPFGRGQECPVGPLSVLGAGTAAGDVAGQSASVSGSTAVFGAPGDDTKGPNAGAIYISTLSNGTWNAPTKIVASDGASGDLFGTSVAIRGSRLVVGAPGDDDAGSDAGSMYVFDLLFGNWFQTAKLIPNGLQANSRFGDAVSVDGNLAGGAATGQSNIAAYVFMKSGSSWVLSDTYPGLGFGRAIALDGNLAAVSFQNTGGAVAVHRLTSGSWSNVGNTQSLGQAISRVAMSGSRLAASNGSQLFFFDVMQNSVPTSQVLNPWPGMSQIGTSLSMWGDRIVVGAKDAQGNGSAKVFFRNEFIWVPDLDLKVPVGIDTTLTSGAGIDAMHAVIGIPAEAVGGGVASGGLLAYPASSNFAFMPHGNSCAGSGGFSPSLSLTGCATPGGTVTLSAAGGLGGSVVFVGFGLNPATIPLSDGCYLNISPLLPSGVLLPLFGANPGQGMITVSSALPIGLGAPASVELQGFFQDPTLAQGYTASNGVTMSVANP